MSGGADDGFGAALGVGGRGEGGGIVHEDSAADEDGFGAELHDQGGVGGGGDASGAEVGDGELAFFRHPGDEFIRSLQLFGFAKQFAFAEDSKNFHVLNNLADVLDGVDDVSGAGFALGADHGGALGNAAESFSKIARPADEWDFEGVLIHGVRFVGRRQHF